MQHKKNSIFAIYKILKDHADEEHPISQTELCKKLEEDYNIKLERRAIYTNLDMLQELGIKLSTWRENGKGYYLKERQFSEGEVSLLCNAIHASHFIPQKESDILIKKLLDTQSRQQKNNFHANTYLPNELKTNNNSIIDNFRDIDKAIAENKQITFHYYHYNEKKELYDSSPKRIISPYFIVHANERAYVVGAIRKNGEIMIRHFRIDRIADLSILDETSIKRPKDLCTDAYLYANANLMMFRGDTIPIGLRCTENALSQMIDVFGTNTIFIKNGDHYDFTVKTSRSGILIFAQQYLDFVQITSPDDVRLEFENRLENALKRSRSLVNDEA